MPRLGVKIILTDDAPRTREITSDLLSKVNAEVEFSEALGQVSFEKETEEVR
jgi:hypothetical protein